jgi:hypothetical protein
MRIGEQEITTVELEKMFYTGVPEELEKVRDALAEEFAAVEDGDNTLRSYITDNLYHADKLLNERTGLYGVLVRALEFADAALDYYENKFQEEIRQAAERNTDEKVKKPTDSVMKAQAAVKVAPYRRFRNYIRGYVSTCEKSLASLRTTVDKCNAQNYLAQRQTFRPQEQSQQQ